VPSRPPPPPPATAFLEARVVDLEIRFTHQDRLLEELNGVVVAQARQIALLEAAVEALRNRVLAQEEAPANERPPHY
jgi:SlyX protein